MPILAGPVADTRTKEQRSRIMAAVRGKHTSPEVALRKALYAAGIRGWRCHYKRAPGRPDLAWPSLRVAVFVDGAFWHGHPSRHRPGRSGRYWDEKIARNVARDRANDAALMAASWIVVRIWDFEIRKDLQAAVERVSSALVAGSGQRARTQRWLMELENRGGPDGSHAARSEDDSPYE